MVLTELASTLPRCGHAGEPDGNGAGRGFWVEVEALGSGSE